MQYFHKENSRTAHDFQKENLKFVLHVWCVVFLQRDEQSKSFTKNIYEQWN